MLHDEVPNWMGSQKHSKNWDPGSVAKRVPSEKRRVERKKKKALKIYTDGTTNNSSLMHIVLLCWILISVCFGVLGGSIKINLLFWEIRGLLCRMNLVHFVMLIFMIKLKWTHFLKNSVIFVNNRNSIKSMISSIDSYYVR